MMTDLELYNFIHTLQEERKRDIKKHRSKNDVRCKNCKCKIRPSKNDFKYKKECKTCWKFIWNNQKYNWLNRKDIWKYDEENDKWIKNKKYNKLEKKWEMKYNYTDHN